MFADEYETTLLEIRQGLREAEMDLKNRPCIRLSEYLKILRLKKIISEELNLYSSGALKNRDLIKLLEG